MKRIANTLHRHFESPAGVRNLLIYTAICCIFSLPLNAQNNSLNGKVLFLNSGNNPAVGVEISGSITIDSTTIINANTVYTAADGSYRLVFPKALPRQGLRGCGRCGVLLR